MDDFFATLVFASLMIVAASSADEPAPIVRTRYGSVRGVRHTLSSNAQLPRVDQYLGIPYAKPPVGSLRFKAPAKPNSWEEVREATSYGPVCLQKVTEPSQVNNEWEKTVAEKERPFLKKMSEDCLYLNVFSPVQELEPNRGDSEIERRPLPVIVFVHGGGFDSGSGSMFDGSVLASYGDVVVVTLNYRLGILGFLNLGGSDAKGNYGIRDVLEALVWVRQNIEAFGGNRKSVTLMGHEAGGIMAEILMKYPESEGRLQRAISHSGSLHSTKAITRDPHTYALEAATRAGCFSSTRTDLMLSCLRAKSADDLVTLDVKAPKYFTTFGPVVDGDILENGDERRRRRKKRAAISPPRQFMTGFTKSESFVYINPEVDFLGRLEIDKYRKLIEEFVNNVFQPPTPEKLKELKDAMRFEYTDWTTGIDNPYALRENLMDILTDNLWAVPAIDSVKANLKLGIPSFLYNFGHKKKDGDTPKWTGAIHGEELEYIFGAPIVKNGIGVFRDNYTDIDSQISLGLMTYWSNFAKSGNPNSPVRQVMKEIHREFASEYIFEDLESWPAYNESQQEYVHLSKEPRIRDFFKSHKMSFWTEYINEMSKVAATTSPPVLTAANRRDTTTRPRDLSTSVLKPKPPRTNNDEGPPKVQLIFKNYTNELRTVIVVGCTLLFFNVLLLALICVVYEKKNKMNDNGSHTTEETNASAGGGPSEGGTPHVLRGVRIQGALPSGRQLTPSENSYKAASDVEL